MTDSVATRALILTSEKLVGIHKIWRELAAGGIGPTREAVTPARLRGTMPWTFVIDVVGEDFRFRFAGDRIIQFMGRRLQGTLLSEHRGTPFFDGMHQFFSRSVTTKMPLTNGPSPVTYPGKEHLEMEVMVLPLSSDGETVTGLLGTFDTWQLGTHASVR
jgi:hypothetical protein